MPGVPSICAGVVLDPTFVCSIAVWDMVSPTEINLRRVLVGHRAAVNVVDFDDKYIVSASGDRTIKVRIDYNETDVQLYT